MVYVEKLVNSQPLCFVGPFDTPEQARAFIARARQEEDRHQSARDAKNMEWYTNVTYVLIQTQH